jgi:hypothetical protein
VVATVADLKKKMKKLKAEREDALKANDSKKADILKRRVRKLKKKTRMAA